MRPTSRPRRSVGLPPRFRPGLVLRRDPRLWWAVVLSVAVGAGALVAAAVDRADQTRRAWGTTQRVLVATHDLEPGEAVDPDDVILEARPRAMVPANAVLELPDTAVALARVLAGEVLVSDRLAPTGLTGVAALLPRGSRAVAIPTEPGTAPPLAVGDHVDVLVALPPDAAGDGPPGFAVATDAVVVALSDSSITVAVARDVAPRIAVALGQGAITLALIGA